MSSVSKEYGREYYTAATYSYRVPHRGINEKLAYLICQKTGKWNSNGVIPSREFQALMTEGDNHSVKEPLFLSKSHIPSKW